MMRQAHQLHTKNQSQARAVQSWKTVREMTQKVRTGCQQGRILRWRVKQIPWIRNFFFLLRLSNPTDPAHVQSNNLKYNEAFIKFSQSVGPCRPVVKFPKNADGRSFQAHWYDNDPWLEYSPQNDAMYCFSCRVFMNEERFQSRTGWKSVGINLWRQAKVKIKEHRSSESHMLSMIRWNAFKRNTLQMAFAAGDSQTQAVKEK